MKKRSLRVHLFLRSATNRPMTLERYGVCSRASSGNAVSVAMPGSVRQITFGVGVNGGAKIPNIGKMHPTGLHVPCSFNSYHKTWIDCSARLFSSSVEVVDIDVSADNRSVRNGDLVHLKQIVSYGV